MTALSTTIRLFGYLFILVLRSHADLGVLAGPKPRHQINQNRAGSLCQEHVTANRADYH